VPWPILKHLEGVSARGYFFRGKDNIKMVRDKDNIKMVSAKDNIKMEVSSGKDVALWGLTKISMYFDSIESFFRRVGYY
jgi:hypothetical protein